MHGRWEPWPVAAALVAWVSQRVVGWQVSCAEFAVALQPQQQQLTEAGADPLLRQIQNRR